MKFVFIKIYIFKYWLFSRVVLLIQGKPFFRILVGKLSHDVYIEKEVEISWNVYCLFINKSFHLHCDSSLHLHTHKHMYNHNRWSLQVINVRVCSEFNETSKLGYFAKIVKSCVSLGSEWSSGHHEVRTPNLFLYFNYFFYFQGNTVNMFCA